MSNITETEIIDDFLKSYIVFDAETKNHYQTCNMTTSEKIRLFDTWWSKWCIFKS